MAEKNEKGGGMTEKKAISRPMGIAVVSLLVALLVVGAVLIYLLTRGETPEREAIRGTVVTAENVDEIRERLERPPEDAYFTANMNVEWYFDRGDSPSSNAFVINDELNTRTVYFDLLLDETDELLFSSPFIPVGARFDDILLNRRLPAGNHPATVVYHLVDDDNNEITSISIAVLLRVLA